MEAWFLDTEQTDQEFFKCEFPADALHFCDRLEDVGPGVEVLSTFVDSRIDAQFLASHSKLRFIATRSTTFDHIDLDSCAKASIAVRGVESYGDCTVTEHTFALILVLLRNLQTTMTRNTTASFSYGSLRSSELHGKTLGVVGAGRIGLQTLRLGRAFGMQPIAYDICQNEQASKEICFDYVSFDELLERSHIISLNLPLTGASYHMFNRETFAKCRPGVIIINTARGGLIETCALIEALDKGIVAGAGLDVLEDERVMRRKATSIISEQIVEHLRDPFIPIEPLVQSSIRAEELRLIIQNSELLERPNVVFTPHIAFNSVEAVQRINRATADNIRSFLSATSYQ